MITHVGVLALSGELKGLIEDIVEEEEDIEEVEEEIEEQEENIEDII